VEKLATDSECLFPWDLSSLGDRIYHVLLDNRQPLLGDFLLTLAFLCELVPQLGRLAFTSRLAVLDANQFQQSLHVAVGLLRAADVAD
jgi:hypothetical protein